MSANQLSVTAGNSDHSPTSNKNKKCFQDSVHIPPKRKITWTYLFQRSIRCHGKCIRSHTFHRTNGIFTDPWMFDFYGFHVGKLTKYMEHIWDQIETGVSKNNGTPKSSILIGFSIINHPIWGTPIFGNTQTNPQKKLLKSGVPTTSHSKARSGVIFFGSFGWGTSSQRLVEVRNPFFFIRNSKPFIWPNGTIISHNLDFPYK